MGDYIFPSDQKPPPMCFPSSHIGLGDPRDFPPKTLGYCPDCDRWFYVHEADDLFWTAGIRTWRPVRWWHFTKRRRIKERARG